MMTRADISRTVRILGAVFVTGCLAAGAGETLYNGLAQPDSWPPDRGAASRDPMEVPWLEHPPAVIPIDVGRQLFVDDFLIADTTLRRTYHQAEYYPENPVLGPDQPWEIESESQGHPAPTAMVFSDGVWYDPAAKLFKMWYMAGYCKGAAYAESRDEIHWEKPALDVVPGTNLVHTERRDSSAEWVGAPDLASLAGKPIRFRFQARSARLFAFWVSLEESGASHGYVAAGGPGFAGTTDTVGAASVR